VLLLLRVLDRDHRRVQAGAVCAFLLDIAQREIACHALVLPGVGFLLRLWPTLVIREEIFMQEVALDLHFDIVQNIGAHHLRGRKPTRPGEIRRIVATGGAATTAAAAIEQTGNALAGIEVDIHVGMPGRTRAARLVTVGIIVGDIGDHCITYSVVCAVPKLLIADMDLIAMWVNHQIQIPTIRRPVAAAVLVRLARVVGAAELFHHAIRQIDIPARVVAKGDFADLGVTFWGRMPDIDVGTVLQVAQAWIERVRGCVRYVWRDELAANTAPIIDMPDILQCGIAVGRHIFLRPANRSQVQIPALPDPGRGRLPTMIFVHRPTGVVEREIGLEAARPWGKIQRIAIVQAAGIEANLEIGGFAPGGLRRLRVEADGVGLRRRRQLLGRGSDAGVGLAAGASCAASRRSQGEGGLDRPRLVLVAALGVDDGGRIMRQAERTGKLQYTLLAFDVNSGEVVGELDDGAEASLEPILFSPQAGDGLVLATSNRSGNGRPLLWNPRTGERQDLPLEELEGEVLPVDWSPDGKQLLLCQFVQAVQHLYAYDLETNHVRAFEHPGGTYTLRGTYFLPDGSIVAQWQDASHPGSVMVLDGQTGRQQRTLLSTGSVPDGRPWRSFMFSSTDGEQIQGWLCVPEGEGPFPTILETHGGPTAVAVEAFDPACQAWVDHGFAFVSINYRGSITFGKNFLEQIWGHPGELEVEDMVGARRWLVEQGIARPDQILLTGWSYGGYLTLQALGKYPGLWAGGMGGVAVADRVLQYASSSDKHKGVIAALFGGTPQEKPGQYRKSSPITYVEQIDVPVLLIQGRNDTRCPARQIEAYEERMRALGKSIEILWFDAGHGSLSVEQRIAFQERMLRFAYQTLERQARK
jgi:dienelactone hydrolase/PAS domain-containing protein